MSEIRLLDCTLRDGGYLNDWKFGHDNIVNIFERLTAAGIDIVEVGFLDMRRPFDPDRTIQPDCASYNKIFAGLNKGRSLVTGMIDYGTCDLAHLMPAKDCFLDGIRVIFKKKIMHEAIAFCKEVKALGYKVFAQAVSITSYNDEEFAELLELVNDLEPYTFSLVDTYGLLHKESLEHYYRFADQRLKPGITLGYHAHNNFQLAYANCAEVIENPPQRPAVVDGTLYGMGKSAGNAPLELLTMTMNQKFPGRYDQSQLLEAIDTNIMEMYRRAPWGYQFKFFLSASHDCHPNYVTYLTDKKQLSIRSISEILNRLEGDKKLLYDKAYIEQLYLDYQKKECDDSQDMACLKEKLSGRTVLLLAPGNSLVSEKPAIDAFIAEEKPFVISVNQLPDYPVDAVFISNPKRYIQMATALRQSGRRCAVIATSNVTSAQDEFDFTLNYGSLLDEEAEYKDNPMIMLLKLLTRCGAGQAVLAGFDGYKTAGGSNFINPNMEYSFTREKAELLNAYAKESLARLGENGTCLPYHFLTKSYYNNTLKG
jgi:4-hydroxy 2-oxovalerate aldolase